MAVTVSNLIMGPGTLYKGDEGATEPADSDVTSPLNETSVSGEWIDLGGTNGGVTLELDQEYTELEVDQIVDIVERRLTKREFKVNTSLAEPTLENFVIANNGGTVTTGSGFKTFDPKQDTSATQPTYVALIFDGIAPSSLRRRVVTIRRLSSMVRSSSRIRISNANNSSPPERLLDGVGRVSARFSGICAPG